ncbi:MAG: FIST C-terminal domain-containing protein [Alphaproteobacteria bacterium]|nr:FIST C-terminal domain-containing protein [Alphaproteobacteria bacterium]
MPLYTSSKFASAGASGADWREAAKAVLETLEGSKTKDKNFNFGFLYITDRLADDAQSIVNLFSSVLQIKNWVGAVGIGICAVGEEFVDRPAISVMLGRFDESDFCVFPPAGIDMSDAEEALFPFLDKNDPMLIFVHGDSSAGEDPVQTLKALNAVTNGFMVGGLSSSRGMHVQFSGSGECSGGVSGVAFTQAIPVASTLSQGCTAIGMPHVITLCDEDEIIELDGKRAVEVFEDDLRSMAIKKIERDPDTVLIDEDALEDEDAVPEEFKDLFRGEVHAAFPVPESDQEDYLVRNIREIDPESGSITVAHQVMQGERVMFVHRNDKSVREDLSLKLLALRERVGRDTGAFEPKGGLYISCISRAFSDNGGGMQGEMALVRDIIGDVPLAGFYAGGEVCNARLYGYTGILVLFL